MAMLKERYQKEVIPAMKEKFGYKSNMAVPKIEKALLNSGFGKLVVSKTSGEHEKIQKIISDNLAIIAGQRPILTRAKKSISVFKLREGMLIGAKITLRKKRMYDFLDRLINVALPRSRDFRGIDRKSINSEGNLTIGIREHIVFPEVSPEQSPFIFGFEVTIVTNAKTREEAIELFRLLGFPIKNS